MRAVDLSLHAGRSFQKEQTGFVHLCYQSKDGAHDTIPVLENALFALSLFRTRLSDPVLEGIALIEKLLPFEVEGNFPVYLHEYPNCADLFLGIRLLPVLFWILHDFSNVLKDLRGQIEACIERIVKKNEGESLPAWAADRLKALEGEAPREPENLTEWGEALISLEIAEARGAQVEPLLAKAWTLWDPELFLYKGKCKRRDQLKGEGAFSLFGLYLSDWNRQFPKSAEEPHRIHLKGSLVRPLKSALPKAISESPFVQFTKDALCPLFVSWKGEKAVHSFVFAKKHLEVDGSGEELILSYPEEIPEEEDRMCEANFYFNYHEEHQIFVNGVKASAFQEGDFVEIRSKNLTIRLSFAGEGGTFFGHLMRGNRPSQHGCVGEAKFAAYDWRLALRTVKRGAEATIRVQVALERTQESQPPLPLHASHCLHTPSSL